MQGFPEVNGTVRIHPIHGAWRESLTRRGDELTIPAKAAAREEREDELQVVVG